MPLAEDDDMVKTFPPDRANQPFGLSVLPWRAWRGWPVSNAHGAKPPVEYLAVDTVAIAEDVPRTGSQPQASVSCRAAHSAVGCAVTPTIRFGVGRA